MDIKKDYKNFDYKVYLFLNSDIIGDFTRDNFENEKCKKMAWNHWIKHGKQEERSLQLINTSKTHNGRFGNLFFINMMCHFLALKYDINFDYKYEENFSKLGIYFYKGNNSYKNFIQLTDDNFLEKINFSHDPCNILINNYLWCQTTEFVEILKKYWYNKFNKIQIKNNNKFKSRYKSNNDLFIHVRLGDLFDKNIDLKNYYLKCLNTLKWQRGFISSDSINSDFCKELIIKFNLNIIDENEVDTIMFSSTCNNLILSGGTFSWMIGFFAYESANIYYPLIKEPWYGRIFEPMNWKVII